MFGRGGLVRWLLLTDRLLLPDWLWEFDKGRWAWLSLSRGVVILKRKNNDSLTAQSMYRFWGRNLIPWSKATSIRENHLA